MKRRLIETYVIKAITPYIVLATLLLTSALLAQQSGKFAELFIGAQTPFEIVGRIFIGLIPNILTFTLPLATLLGVIIGFSRLSSDSEITALRAAGIGSSRLIAPALLVGLSVSVLTFFNGFHIAPKAAHMLREEALNVALYKLQTPIEPRTFNTDFPDKVLYVRNGDESHGEWGKVFIYSQDGSDNINIYTARNGRIDVSGDRSELVLTDASVLTLPEKANATSPKDNAQKNNAQKNGEQLSRDHSTQSRVRLVGTNRNEIIRKAQTRQFELDELNWNELKAQSKSKDSTTRQFARIAFHKRMALCVAPLVFTLLGSALGALTRRGGRGAGMLLGLVASLTYYLVALAGEQLAKAGSLPPYAVWSGVILASGGALFALHFNQQGYGSGRRWSDIWRRIVNRFSHEDDKISGVAAQPSQIRSTWIPSRLLDWQMLRGLAGNFALAFLGLNGLVLIFTVFELLRYIAVTGASVKLIGRYLLFLTPMVSVAIAPLAMLVAGLGTYTVLVRRSEAVAWLAAGQSLYRLTLPGFLFAFMLCGGIWLTEEKILPTTNRIQGGLRQQIRGDAARAVTSSGRRWLATNDGCRLYAYDNIVTDESRIEYGSQFMLGHPVLYEFDDECVFLRRIVYGETATWMSDGAAIRFDESRRFDLDNGGRINRTQEKEFIVSVLKERPEDFKQMLNNVSYLDTNRLRNIVALLKRQRAGNIDANTYAIALQRRFVDVFAPVVMTLIGIPMAFIFGRRGTLTALIAAIVVGLGFWGAVSGFNQLGLYQLVPPPMAAWAAPLIFTAIGAYLFARVRT
ncbi:MAG: hypothetical protein NVSMB56_02650 [Pyrinomonadaceae bacterium]